MTLEELIIHANKLDNNDRCLLAESFGWGLEQDNYGQILFYTDLMFDEHDNVVEFQLPEGEGK